MESGTPKDTEGACLEAAANSCCYSRDTHSDLLLRESTSLISGKLPSHHHILARVSYHHPFPAYKQPRQRDPGTRTTETPTICLIGAARNLDIVLLPLVAYDAASLSYLQVYLVGIGRGHRGIGQCARYL